MNVKLIIGIVVTAILSAVGIFSIALNKKHLRG